jgi:hypothetical protein
MSARDELREAVIDALTKGDWISPRLARDIADAALREAIPRIEAETREACAKVAEGPWDVPTMETKVNGKPVVNNRGHVAFVSEPDAQALVARIAAAIRNQEPKA